MDKIINEISNIKVLNLKEYNNLLVDVVLMMLI